MARAGSYSVSRDFTRGELFTRGSRFSRSQFQGLADPGPTRFAPGGVTGSSAAVKLAHALLTYGQMKRAREREEAYVAQEEERHGLELDRLRTQADPNYISPYQAQSLDLQRARLQHTVDQDALAKTGTPRVPVHLQRDFGRYGAGMDVDPNELSAETSRLGQQATDRRAMESQQRRTTAQRKYTAAAAALRELEARRAHAADAAEQVARQTIRRQRGELFDKNTDRARRTALMDSLGLAPKASLSALKTKGLPAGIDDEAIKEHRRAAEQQFDELFGQERDRLLKVIYDEAGLAMDENGPAPIPSIDPRTQRIIDAWRGMDAAPPR